MRSLQTKRGFTLIELLVVIAIIAILASILFPVFAKAREKARQTTCTSQIRQLATAIQMYTQDNNGRFPGLDWTNATQTYTGSQKIYFCPSDAANDTEAPVSYGYSALLLRPDQTGLNEAQVKAPTEVGAICDTSPAKTFGTGGIVGGGALADPVTYSVTPNPRHNGVIVGYCDGHAKFAPGKIYSDKDFANPVNRAFYMAQALGFVESFGAGVESVPNITNAGASRITLGGDACTMPMLTAAAEVWKAKTQVPYYTRGFLGQYEVTGRPSYTAPNATQGGFVWGCGDGDMTAPGNNLSKVAIGVDAMVVIVSKNTKLFDSDFPIGGGKVKDYFPNINKERWGMVRTINAATLTLTMGATSNTTATAYVGYTYDLKSGSRNFFERTLMAHPAGQVTAASTKIGTKAIVVKDDLEMVEKVAADPYGIGYCSAAFADTDKVYILAIDNTNAAVGTITATATKVFPNSNFQYKTTYPADFAAFQTEGWPLTRTLYALCSQQQGTTNISTIGAAAANAAPMVTYTAATGNVGGTVGYMMTELFGNIGTGTPLFKNAPMYKASYWWPCP